MNEFENPGITLEYISEDQNSLGLFFICKKHKHLRPTFLAVFVKLSDTKTLCTWEILYGNRIEYLLFVNLEAAMKHLNSYKFWIYLRANFEEQIAFLWKDSNFKLVA